MSKATRRRRPSALSRARFRTLFFTLLTFAALALGLRLGAGGAAAGVAAGAWSVAVARNRGISLTHSFAVADWLLLGVIVAVSGGARSSLLFAVPLLVLAQLLPSERAEWPFLVAPVLVLTIVVAIADPTLGGNRAEGLAKVFALTAAGIIAVYEIKRPRARGAARRGSRRASRAVSVDSTTGFYTQARLHDLVALRMNEARDAHQPLSVICVEMDHFADMRDFLGAAGAEAVVQSVARRLQRLLAADDLAFRVAPDTFVLALTGRTLPQAQTLANTLCHDVGAHLIGRHRQTLSAGAASFPTTRSLQDLLVEAHDAIRHAPPVPAHVGGAVRRRSPRLAAAQ